jgi:uncharacterized ferritin-like protein (DUF455 family)
MELRDFAEQVLFATTLADKLTCPDVLTDERPGPALAAPAEPGRPAELRFKPAGGTKAEFPGLHRLDNATERGRLLHFFANHELLATELMALVLLRFPDAPAAFRRGVLQTLRDEQEHTRLYVERMRACGLTFGELPVSGFFWRSVAGMASPLDYVAGLSLTFEQANLDFSRHFAQGFATVGDTESAALLERIYRDEIGHVAYGLKWFRRWKNPGESDWDAFCHQLKFPLTPRRAKGFAVNAAGRQAAGLDADFIAQLDVYSQSKGRTPNVFWFNPLSEAVLAQGGGFTPGKIQATLTRDLAALPMFLAREDDVVLVPRRPAVGFLSGLKQAGFPLPEFVEIGAQSARDRESAAASWSAAAEQGEASAVSPDQTGERPSARPAAESGGKPPHSKTLPRSLDPLRERKLGRLRPWAWGPDSVEFLAPLFANLSGEVRRPAECFNPAVAELYSKAWSADFLRAWLDEGVNKVGQAASLPETGESLGRRPACPAWLCADEDVGVAVDSIPDALSAIRTIRDRGHHRIVVKQALGLAGQNALRLWEPDLLPTQLRWLENLFAQGRRAVVEPWLERLADFSVQLEMTASGLELIGYAGLLNDVRGQFQANYAAPDFSRRLPAAVTDCFRGHAEALRRLPRLYPELLPRLAAELRAAGFLGPLGIDAFVYRDAAGNPRLKPIVEINPRYTMGRLTLELMKRLAPGSHGCFRLINRPQLRALGQPDFPTLAQLLTQRDPVQLEGEPVPRLRSGTVCLNDPAEAEVCLAVFQATPPGQLLAPT